MMRRQRLRWRIQAVQSWRLIFVVEPEPLPAPEQGAVLKHGDGLGMESPEGALAPLDTSMSTSNSTSISGIPGHLDEAVIEA